MSTPLSRRSRRIVLAWIACDVGWLLAFIQARRRDERAVGLAR